MPISTRLLIVFLVVGAVSCTPSGCRRQTDVPDAVYRDAVVAFHTGLAALQTSQEVLAREQFERVIELVPDEPAAWANIGLLLLRQQEVGPAHERLTRAAELAPDNGHIQRLLALSAGRQGDLPTAVRHWRRSLELEPDNVRAAYSLALDLERQGGDANEAEAQRTLDALAARTGNLVVQLDLARLAAKREDTATLKRAIDDLAKRASAWPEDVQPRFAAVRDAAVRDPRAAGRQIAFLRNVLVRLPEYRAALAEVSTPREEVGQPLERFLVLPNPGSQAAARDETLAFDVRETGAPPVGADGWAGAIWLTGDGGPAIAAVSDVALRLILDGGREVIDAVAGPRRGSLQPDPAGVAAADLDYDYRTDLVVAGANGVAILRQTEKERFTDVTDAAKLPAAIRSAPAFGVWPADIDTDGDLDLVVARIDGPAHVLRNNTDGTFAVQEPFAGVTRVRGFAWADLDGEGVPDAALLQADGRVRVFLNARGGSFRERGLPGGFPNAVAIAAAEVSGDAVMDLVALASNGTIVRLSQAPDGRSWTQGELARLAEAPKAAPGVARVLVADVDNNAASDLVISGTQTTTVLLGGADRAWRPLKSPVNMETRSAADLDGDGRLELIGLSRDGRIATAVSRGGKNYHWQVLRPRAATATGDQRINSFGIGGEAEVRTALHVQRLLVESPVVHVGLGEATSAEVARLFWPNGTVQSEFGLKADASIAATQRLKGSCPWLFAWDGREMRFVTDVLWRSPLGLRINAQETASVATTEDRVKVAGSQLAPRDGYYDLRITAELWETHFFDLVSLLVVDHPEGTEVWMDERFAIPPPSLEPIVTGPVRPLAAARDDRGRDVSELVGMRDDRHVDFAGRGKYQGITRDHFIELELPDEAPRTEPLWLVAQGWIHPTDSSVNVAISQGNHPAPYGLALQVADESGRFRTVAPSLGFPAGKDKTMLVDLAGVLPTRGPRRLRLATNMEIFWDRIGWAVGRPDVRLRTIRLEPASAELRYRGYSVTEQREASSPERPRYRLEGTAPRWRDLEGYHTRFGDVRPLVLRVDDRYVIMNAGDELALRFPEAPPPRPGEVRDFVMISDGWEKDGDYNTTFSRTVLPLPTHENARYDRQPGRLEDDPVYRKHPRDFVDYHTRYVTPDRVRDALRRPEDARQ